MNRRLGATRSYAIRCSFSNIYAISDSAVAKELRNLPDNRPHSALTFQVQHFIVNRNPVFCYSTAVFPPSIDVVPNDGF